MPLGSSSDAPVSRPGPKARQKPRFRRSAGFDDAACGESVRLEMMPRSAGAAVCACNNVIGAPQLPESRGLENPPEDRYLFLTMDSAFAHARPRHAEGAFRDRRGEGAEFRGRMT